jgi:hypothetical protein
LLDSGSVTLTAADPAPWWQVDLGHDHAVSAVTIWARTDCCTGDLGGARVELLDANGRVLTRRLLARRAPILPVQGIPLDGSKARFVRVIGAPNRPLALAEVEVWEKALSVGQGVCWKRSQGRGVGIPLTTCSDASPDKNGQLCYPKCAPSYDGNGPVCWKVCPDGYVDNHDHYESSGKILIRVGPEARCNANPATKTMLVFATLRVPMAWWATDLCAGRPAIGSTRSTAAQPVGRRKPLAPIASRIWCSLR